MIGERLENSTSYPGTARKWLHAAKYRVSTLNVKIEMGTKCDLSQGNWCYCLKTCIAKGAALQDAHVPYPSSGTSFPMTNSFMKNPVYI